MRTTPWVGRDTELADLAQDLDAALAGAGRLVVLSGPAGIGKTALAERIARLAADRGVPVARGRCLDDEGAPPLWPWTRLAGPVETPADEGPTGRFLLVDALVRTLLDGARDAGGVVLLEDLHWADPASLQALRHLAGDGTDARLLTVVAVRSPWPEPVAAALGDVLRRPGCRLAELRPLAMPDVRRLLGVTDDDLATEVHRRTGGSPLLVRAVASVWDGDGDLWDRVASASDVGRFAAGAMLTLDAPARDTVELAAVLGERVDGDLVGTEHLADAVRAGLLETKDGYRFAHALVRDAIVAGLDPARRRVLHRRAGDLLRERASSDPSYAAARAGHLLRAGGRPAELVGAAADAAREADRRLGHEDAARWWAVAVDAGGGTAAERAGHLLELARAEYRGGRYTESLDACGRAAELGLALQRGDLVAEAATVIEGLSMPQAFHAVDTWCQQAGDLLGDDADPGLRARLLAQHAWAHLELGRLEEAERTSSRALELAHASKDPLALLAAVQSRSMVRFGPDGVAEQLELGRTAIRVGTAAGRPIPVLLGHVWRCTAAFMLGNLEAGQAEIDAVARLAERTRLPLVRWHHLRMLASLALMDGRFEQGLVWSDEAFDLMAASGDVSAAGMSGAYLQQVAMTTGRAELLADERFDQLFALAPPLPIVRAAGALIALIRGRRDEAAARYAGVRPLLFDPPRDPRWMGTVSYLLEIAEALQDGEAAARIRAELEPWEGLPGALGATTVVFRGALERDTGRMAAVAGDLAGAERLLRLAVASNVRLGARPYVVLSRVELAEVLVRAGGAPAEIADLAERARAEAARLGMPGPQRRAEALLKARTDPLTTREREVAALVAKALSNRQIAAELVLSERTVESHVRNILSKLGFTRRTEIATHPLS